MIRILHASDFHLEPGFSAVPASAFLSKRLLGYVNLVLRRRAHFEGARATLDRLVTWAEKQRWDAVLCTGDYTALGTDEELAFARESVARLSQLAPRFITMPGNHDRYATDAFEKKFFEKHFGAWIRSDLYVDGRQEPWPQVHFIGNDVAVIAVDSTNKAPEAFDSSGYIQEEELRAFSRVLSDPKVANRFILVATHYALRRPNGEPDAPTHGLRNAEQLIDACRGIDAGMIAFGHIHHRYQQKVDRLKIPIFGAGSATYKGREGAWVYEIENRQLRATKVRWNGQDFEMESASPSAG